MISLDDLQREKGRGGTSGCGFRLTVCSASCMSFAARGSFSDEPILERLSGRLSLIIYQCIVIERKECQSGEWIRLVQMHNTCRTCLAMQYHMLLHLRDSFLRVLTSAPVGSLGVSARRSSSSSWPWRGRATAQAMSHYTECCASGGSPDASTRR